MLSINALGRGQEEYYLKLAREDYYLRGSEPPGYWLGSGAAALGLAGAADADHFRRLFDGYGPDGRPLVQNAGAENRQPGWDLTFTAPKDVSVFWAMAGAGDRSQVEQAHAAAVAAAMGFLEDDFAWTRRGKAGAEAEPCGLLAAAFEHGTSREQDCNLHTHVILTNVGVRADGTTGSILSKPLYETKMAAGALYRAELARQLQQRLGLACEPKQSWFTLSGVPADAAHEFSTRRKQIEAELAERGCSGAKASEAAALATRQAKEARPRDELFAGWQDRGRAVGFGPDEAARLIGVARPCGNPAARLRAAVPEAVRRLTDTRSHFAERDVVRGVAEAVQAEGIAAVDIRGYVRAYLEGSPDVVRLGVRDRLPRYTTTELFEIEAKLLAGAERAAGDRSKDLPDHAVTAALAAAEAKAKAAGRELSDEQVAAVRHLTQGGGGVRVVSGLAGTGKTTLLDAARDAWERGGMTVVGAALAGKAAQGLQDGAHIASNTIHRRLIDLAAGRLKLTPKSVVVIDEAGMVGTRHLAQLADHCREAGSLLVLVGDHRQLQSVDAGGAFKGIGDRIGRAELTQITRQSEEWAREAVRRVVGGDAASALAAFADRGLLAVADDRAAAMRELVAAWRAGGAADPERHLIFAGTNEEAARLNRLCQGERRAAGHVSGVGLAVGTDLAQPGDRVLFTRNDRSVGVKNGSLGTVTAADPALQTLRVRLDGGREVVVPLETYDDVRLGYAVTTHKGQGVTVDHAYVLAGGPMTDRELAYVQLSRARATTRVFVDRTEAGEQLGDLARAMAKSRPQELAHDVAAGPEGRTATDDPTARTEPMAPEVVR
jgi:conjugative relaxase-like TrwC/TraI family protein